MPPGDRIAAGARRAALAVVIGILGLSSWACLIVGIVIMASPALGMGGAFLVMAGALAATALLIGLVLRLAVVSQRQRSKPFDPLARIALSVLKGGVAGVSDRQNLRLALLAAAAISAGIALLLPRQKTEDQE